MPSVSETITIPSPPDEVWPLLADPALVAACIPGATLSPDQSDGVWRGSVRVKFGPTVAIFKGEATLAYDHAARRCKIDGRGIDGRGASRALASGVVSAKGTDQTELAIDGDFSVTGPLETFANAGGVHVARALLGEFAKNLGAVIAERRSAVPAAEPAPAAATPPPASARSVAPATAAAPGAGTPSPAPEAAPVAPPPPASAPPRPPVAEISAARIAWLAFLSWLRNLFGKGTHNR